MVIEASMGLFRRLTERLQNMRARANSTLAMIRNSMLQLRSGSKKVAAMSSGPVISDQIVDEPELPSGFSNTWRLTTDKSRGAPALTGPCASVSSQQKAPQCFPFEEDTTGDPTYESGYSEEEEEEDSLCNFDWNMSIGSDSVFTDTLSYSDQTWNILVPEDTNSKASSLTISSKRNDDCLSVHIELVSLADSEDSKHTEKDGGKRAMSDTELHNSFKSRCSFISGQHSGRFTVHQDCPAKSLHEPLLAVTRLARPLLPAIKIHRNDWYSPPKNFRPRTTILTVEC